MHCHETMLVDYVFITMAYILPSFKTVTIDPFSDIPGLKPSTSGFALGLGLWF